MSVTEGLSWEDAAMSPRLMPAWSVTGGLSWVDATMSPRRMPAAGWLGADAGMSPGWIPGAIVAVSGSSLTEGLLWADTRMSPRLMPATNLKAVSAVSVIEGSSWEDVAMSPRLVATAGKNEGLPWEDVAMPPRWMPAVIKVVTESSTMELWSVSPRGLLPVANMGGALLSLTGQCGEKAGSSVGEAGWSSSHTAGAEWGLATDLVVVR